MKAKQINLSYKQDKDVTKVLLTTKITFTPGQEHLMKRFFKSLNWSTIKVYKTYALLSLTTTCKPCLEDNYNDNKGKRIAESKVKLKLFSTMYKLNYLYKDYLTNICCPCDWVKYKHLYDYELEHYSLLVKE
jgi:hypothetical protein